MLGVVHMAWDLLRASGKGELHGLDTVFAGIGVVGAACGIMADALREVSGTDALPD
jgi:hypothetical protein